MSVRTTHTTRTRSGIKSLQFPNPGPATNELTPLNTKSRNRKFRGYGMTCNTRFLPTDFTTAVPEPLADANLKLPQTRVITPQFSNNSSQPPQTPKSSKTLPHRFSIYRPPCPVFHRVTRRSSSPGVARLGRRYQSAVRRRISRKFQLGYQLTAGVRRQPRVPRHRLRPLPHK